MVLCSMV